ncbi:major facilitator superfamily domain-containing protein [Triangularia setosa]|uniref:Major facilitator superfamily domain-containing protein n=1 Tax=Triangularia setosa TaxID=2587417 RepID=A0AAN7A6R5_9PEZI|nr:major facilitator superfamily domain-containing protein [Podospora setosa]
MYKGFRLGKSEAWYASPIVQLLMVAMVCFLCPGMFNALTGLGAGGQVDPGAQNDANTALYSTFAVVAFFSGTVTNLFGVKPTLAFGALGYCIYAASFLSYNHNENRGFVVFAGAFLGICAGLLWTAQGTIMMSYPSEDKKGRYISWFWIIFNLGAVIGSLVPLGQNINATGSSAVNDGTYIGFIVLMLVGAALALLLCNASNVIRHDGTKVILMKNPSWKTEIKGLAETITLAPWVILLFPMFFASNIFYTYQLNDMNLQFNTRTRTLNSLLYWTSQILGASVFGYALDITRFRRSVRAKASLVVLFSLTFVIWGGGWAWQRLQVPREVLEAPDSTHRRIDWTDGGEKYIGPMFLFMFYGFYDAAWQTCIYWYMGALSNSGRKAANLAGFYKGIQSAGAAVFWRLDGLKTPFNTIFGVTWGLLAAALLFAAPVIWLKVKDTVTAEEDLKFSDETITDVVTTKDAAKEAV